MVTVVPMVRVITLRKVMSRVHGSCSRVDGSRLLSQLSAEVSYRLGMEIEQLPRIDSSFIFSPTLAKLPSFAYVF